MASLLRITLADHLASTGLRVLRLFAAIGAPRGHPEDLQATANFGGATSALLDESMAASIPGRVGFVLQARVSFRCLRHDVAFLSGFFRRPLPRFVSAVRRRELTVWRDE
ncbi:MAG TPA: hypothetical protein VKP66_16840 [Steroidobacteraceae bacterium]|nr:hypothetical protein [Steroidobacteraceae bacterium]